jgi:hypothetical protein
MNTLKEYNLRKIKYLDEIADTLKFDDAFFKGYEETIRKSIKSNKHSVLLFIFPYMEKMIRYIMGYYPEFDMEVYDQGKYRTMKSMLDLNKEKLVDMFGEDTYSQLINLYDGKKSLRNISCHTTNEESYLLVDMNLAKYILLRLIRIINNLEKNIITDLVSELI